MYLVPRFSIIWWSKSANCSTIEDIVVVKEDIEIICLEESRGLYLCYECTCVACLGLLLCT